MPNWKKVVVSGSDAILNSATATAGFTGSLLGTATTATATTAALTAGTYLTSGGTFNGSTARTFAVDATDANTASKVVARDGSGNFAAGTITAALSGNASTATLVTGTSGQLQTKDDRIIEPNSITTGRLQFGFTSWNNDNGSPYADYLHLRSYTDASGGSDNLVMIRKDALGMRVWQQAYRSATAYSSFKDVAWTDGTNASGTWGIGISGNASTATTATTATNVVGTANRILYNSGTNTTTTSGNLRFDGSTLEAAALIVPGNATVTGSVTVTGSLLVRDGLGTVLDTTNYNLVDGAVTSVAWGSRKLRDTSNFATVDWEGLSLASPQGGGVVTVEWGSGQLNDTSTSQSIDWDSRTTHDGNEAISIDYGTRLLVDTNGTSSLDWNGRLINDADGSIAINYGARRLNNGAGISLLTWGGTSAALEGTASWATNVVNNGVTSVGGTGTVNGISLSGAVTSTGNLTLGGTLSGIGNAQLTNSSITIGSTAISLGASSTTLTGLTSVTATSFIGTASKADTILITEELSTDQPCYPTFTRYTPGYQSLFTDSTGLIYKPNSNTLAATTFEGTLNGNASTAATATNANNIAVTNTTTGAGPYYLVFADGTTGNRTARVDSSTLTYNATTNALTAGTFDGTASYASQSGYTIQFVLATTGSNPAANTTYRMGAAVRAQLTTAAGTTRIYVPRPGKVRYAAVYMRVDGTLASAGTTVVQLAKNTTTGENIGSPTTFGSTTLAVVTSSVMSMSLVQGDFVEINISTPVWGTLPTRVECSGIIYIENNA